MNVPRQVYGTAQRRAASAPQQASVELMDLIRDAGDPITGFCPRGEPPVLPAHPTLRRCSLCWLLVGHRRKVQRCASCQVLVCSYCADKSAAGAVWCGGCELSRATSLSQSSKLFPSRAVSAMQGARGAVSKSQERPGSSNGIVAAPTDANRCALCHAVFSMFSSRRKSLCTACKLVVCDGCSKRAAVRHRAPPDGVATTTGGLEGLMLRLKESSDARVCLRCDSR